MFSDFFPICVRRIQVWLDSETDRWLGRSQRELCSDSQCFAQSPLDHVECKRIPCADLDRLRIDLHDARAFIQVSADTIGTQRLGQMVTDAGARVDLCTRSLGACWRGGLGRMIRDLSASGCAGALESKRRGF